MEKNNLINKENVLFTKFCVSEHAEFSGPGKEDNYFVYAIERDVSLKRI